MGKLKASTLVEVMVAMVLIAIAVGIGSIIFMNITQHSNNMLLHKAQCIIELNELKKIPKNASTENEVYKDDNLVVIQKLSIVKETPNFVLVEYAAKDAKGKTLLKHKKLQITE